MGCNCCKDRDDVRRDDPEINVNSRRGRRGRQPAAQPIGSPVRPAGGAGRTVPPRTYTCDICGLTLDPALFDSHRETCRTNHRRRVRTAAEESAATAAAHAAPPRPSREPTVGLGGGMSPQRDGGDDDDDELSPEEACIVCFEKPKAYAFIPCGHLAVCKGCAHQLDMCPVCRGPRDGLLFVEPTSKLCVCKHCKHVIGPTFFDSHREVCGMRMRQAAAAGADRGASGVATSEAAESEARTCIECRSRPREHALLPCGHLLYCSECAPKISTCPQCCATVTGSQATYHT